MALQRIFGSSSFNPAGNSVVHTNRIASEKPHSATSVNRTFGDSRRRSHHNEAPYPMSMNTAKPSANTNRIYQAPRHPSNGPGGTSLRHQGQSATARF